MIISKLQNTQEQYYTRTLICRIYVYLSGLQSIGYNNTLIINNLNKLLIISEFVGLR